MQLQYDPVKLSMVRAFGGLTRCPLCDDWMIAPVTSGLVQGRKIRHLWACDACGETTLVHIDLEDIRSVSALVA
jgi:hypothetical protein